MSSMQVGMIARYFLQIDARRHGRIVVNVPGRARNPLIEDERETTDAVDFKWLF